MELTKLQKKALGDPFYFEQNGKVPGPQFAELREFKRYRCSLLLTVNEEEPNRWVWKSSVAAGGPGGMVPSYSWKKNLKEFLFKFGKSRLESVGQGEIRLDYGPVSSVIFTKPLTKEEIDFLGKTNAQNN